VAEAYVAISALETRMTIKTLAAKGQPNRAIAGQLGVAESMVR
jgi:DNA-binding NarL/FixJ family response regulator